MKLVAKDDGQVHALVVEVKRREDGVLRCVTATGESYSRRALEAEGLELVVGNQDERAQLEVVGWLKPRASNGRQGPPGVSLECNCADDSQLSRNACPHHTPRDRLRTW